MEVPYLALSKQLILVFFTLSFTLTGLALWFSDLEKHGEAPFQDLEEHHG